MRGAIQRKFYRLLIGHPIGSVVDFLEVILADFARLESETTSTEAAELEEYKKYMFESEKDMALKDNEKKHAEAGKARVSNKSYKQEPRARGISKMQRRGTNQSDNSGILATWDTRRMHRK